MQFKKPVVFPPSLSTQISTTLIKVVDAGTGAYPNYFKLLDIDLNSLVDAYTTPATSQKGLWYAQLKQLYNGSIVHATKIQLQMIETSSSKTFKCVSKVSLQGETDVPSDEQAGSDPQSTMTLWVNGTDGNQRTNIVNFSRYVGMRQFFNDKIDDRYKEFETTKIGDAEKICTFRMWIRHLDETNLANPIMRYRLNITQWVTFSDRIHITS